MSNETNNTELEIYNSIILHSRINENFLSDSTGQAADKNDYPLVKIKASRFPITEEIYNRWQAQNQNPIFLRELSFDLDINFFSQTNLNSILQGDRNRWSVFYTITRPGISEDKQSGIIQVTAFCPAGPPNYGTIYYLQKINSTWNISGNYGLYNQ